MRVDRVGVAGHELLNLDKVGSTEASAGDRLLPPRRRHDGRHQDRGRNNR
jgi:hypothetical protein